MGVFIALVFVAYIYVWRKGGLDWSEEPAGAAPIPLATVRAESEAKEAVGAR